jgi:hypothetical protein
MRMVQVTDADDMASFTPKQLGVLGPEEIHHRADGVFCAALVLLCGNVSDCAVI